ncbi:MAG: hypothetical protein EOM68_06655 [Spirochaetia bacterium]|nr:hypothetical protein [Spirochaetia bacterium]
MNKLGLYNLALSLLDMKIDSLQTPTKELGLLELNYGKVVSFCLKAWDFPFLIKLQMLEDYAEDVVGNPMTWNNYMYGYTVPDDFGRAVQLNASKKNAYAYRFGKLWCNILKPELEYMPNTLSVGESGEYACPDDFLALVAYQLALHVAPMLDPQSQAQSVAAQMYQLTLTSIVESETRSNDRPADYEASPEWGEGIMLTTQAVRDAIFRGEI